MLIKRSEGKVSRGGLAESFAGLSGGAMDRRGFLRKSGVVAGGLGALGALGAGTVRKAEAGPMQPGVAVVKKKNICTHCSV
ncbi:MAG: hypothetical protein MUC89_15235, partial [Acetobacteraceae bacterium]|nr:hypothetical protein [Acetobacteraceae bacterium]